MAYGLCTADDDAGMMSVPKTEDAKTTFSKSELLDKIDALSDVKGVPMEEICKLAKVSDLAELNTNRLEDCLSWLAQQ